MKLLGKEDLLHLLDSFREVRDKSYELKNSKPDDFSLEKFLSDNKPELPQTFARTTPFLTHKIFNSYHSETRR